MRRSSRSRTRRTETTPVSITLRRFAAVLVLLAVFLYVAMSSYNGVPGKSYKTAYAVLPETGNLNKHDAVRVAGARVGQVVSLTVTDDGQARVKLQLDPSAELPADTAIVVRANGLLGARYVELAPGKSPSRLADGATIKGTTTSLTYGVPESLDTFDKDTRGALGTTVRELGTGLLSNGEILNDAVRLAAPVTSRFKPLVDTVLADPADAQRLLPSLSAATGALAANRKPLGKLLTPAGRALQPFVTERDATRAALDAAPGALAAAQGGLSNGQRLLASADKLATAAHRTLPVAPAGLRAATRLLHDSHRPLTRTASLLRDARPAVPAVLKLTGALSPLLKPVTATLSDLRDMLDVIAPYGCDIVNFGAVFRSVTGFGGYGSGPLGEASQFRLQVIPPVPGELLGIKDTSGLTYRDKYAPPCKYLSKPYDVIGGSR